MKDGDQTAALSLSQNDDLPGYPWAFDEFSTDEDSSDADLATGLTSLGFIRSALRRSAWLWCAIALAGLLAGFGLFVKLPLSYEAATSLLLTNPPLSTPGVAITDDQAIAQSRAVAGDALRKLGLRQSAASFTADYTATPVTDRVLLITVKATSSDGAVREANALATAFLTFQAHLLDAQQKLVNASLQQKVTQAQQHLDSVSKQISQLSAQPASPRQRSELSRLRAERSHADVALTTLQQTTNSNQASTEAATASQVKGSVVLDGAVPIKQSRKKRLLLYAGGGLLAGLTIGLGIVVVGALVSDRLRRRDDVAQAIGAPVLLSVGKVRLSRWRPSRNGLAAARSTNVRRIVAHLGSAIPPRSGGPASLAVIPVDDVQVPAVCLVSLAISCAQQGLQVVVADLCSGSPAARLVGTTDPGVRAVSVHDAHLIVAVPDRDDVAPVGPLGHEPRQAQRSPFGEAAAACASADLLLTMVTVHPALGGEQLAGWATGAVAMVTAGRSSASRIYAVGELIRLAGTELTSAVLVGADKDDESLGIPRKPSTPAPAGLGS